MENPGDIFSEFVDRDEELNQLLEMLNKRLPDGRFQLLLDNNSDILRGEAIHLSRETRDSGVNRAKKEGKPNCETTKDHQIYSTPIITDG